MKERQAKAHIRAANVYADLSYCKRLKVGCVIVKDNRIISIGYNGTPAGADNVCEDEHGATKQEVIHAEDNALSKLDRSAGETAEGSTVFVTHAPCKPCAEKIVAAKVPLVIYEKSYRDTNGIQYLVQHGVVVQQLTQ